MLKLYDRNVSNKIYNPNIKGDATLKAIDAVAQGEQSKQNAFDSAKVNKITQQTQLVNTGLNIVNTGVNITNQALEVGSQAYNFYKNYTDGIEQNKLTSANLKAQKEISNLRHTFQKNPNLALEYAQTLNETGDGLNSAEKSQELRAKVMSFGDGLRNQEKDLFRQSLESSLGEFQREADQYAWKQKNIEARNNHNETKELLLHDKRPVEQKFNDYQNMTASLVATGTLTLEEKVQFDKSFKVEATGLNILKGANEIIGNMGVGEEQLNSIYQKIEESEYLSYTQKEELKGRVLNRNEEVKADHKLKVERYNKQYLTSMESMCEDGVFNQTLTREQLAEFDSNIPGVAKKKNFYMKILDAEAKKDDEKADFSKENAKYLNSIVYDPTRTKDEKIHAMQMLAANSKISEQDLKVSYTKIKSTTDNPMILGATAEFRDVYNLGKDETLEGTIAETMSETQAMQKLYKIINEAQRKAVENGTPLNPEETTKLIEELTLNLTKERIDLLGTVEDVDYGDVARATKNSIRKNELVTISKIFDEGTSDFYTRSEVVEGKKVLEEGYTDILKSYGLDFNGWDNSGKEGTTFMIKDDDRVFRFKPTGRNSIQLQVCNGVNFGKFEYEEHKKPEVKNKNYTAPGGTVTNLKEILNGDDLETARKEVKRIMNTNKSDTDKSLEYMRLAYDLGIAHRIDEQGDVVTQFEALSKVNIAWRGYPNHGIK